MMIASYRIFLMNKPVGVVAADSSQRAEGYALGKYGSGASVEEINVDDAVSVGGICVLASSSSRMIGGKMYRAYDR